MNRLSVWLFSGITGIFRTIIDLISIIIHPLYKASSKDKIQILGYHRVCALPETDDIMKYLNVPPASFASQMELLSQDGFNVITLEEFVECRDKNTKLPTKTVIITFDDGYRDNYLNAFPVLRKHDFKGTFFITTDYISEKQAFNWLKLGEESLAHYQKNKGDWLPLSRQEILEMNAQGSCFGSHTKSHCNLTQMDESKAMEELTDSKKYLEEMLQKPVTCFSYPYGEINNSAKNWIQTAGYRAAVVKWGSNALKNELLELHRTPINSQDSLAKFRRKVYGAYDWWFKWILPLVLLIQQIIPRGYRRA